ncbi:unnamed protein product, partial [Meganyctiphanes norvegica]
KMMAQRKQILLNWVVKNLGTDTLLGLSEACDGNKNVISEMAVKDKKMHDKLSKHEKRTFIHSIQKQTVTDGHICCPVDCVLKMIPADASLVFMDVTLEGAVMGRIQIHLQNKLPKIRDYLVHIFTGQRGDTLVGKQFNHVMSEVFGINQLQFSGMKVTLGSNVGSTAKHGDVCGWF